MLLDFDFVDFDSVDLWNARRSRIWKNNAQYLAQKAFDKNVQIRVRNVQLDPSVQHFTALPSWSQPLNFASTTILTYNIDPSKYPLHV